MRVSKYAWTYIGGGDSCFHRHIVHVHQTTHHRGGSKWWCLCVARSHHLVVVGLHDLGGEARVRLRHLREDAGGLLWCSFGGVMMDRGIVSVYIRYIHPCRYAHVPLPFSPSLRIDIDTSTRTLYTDLAGDLLKDDGQAGRVRDDLVVVRDGVRNELLLQHACLSSLLVVVVVVVGW